MKRAVAHVACRVGLAIFWRMRGEIHQHGTVAPGHDRYESGLRDRRLHKTPKWSAARDARDYCRQDTSGHDYGRYAARLRPAIVIDMAFAQVRRTRGPGSWPDS